MIATARQDPQTRLPGLSSEPSALPHFHVQFSPGEARFSAANATNSFQWVGKGLLTVQERGMTVRARRAFLLGLRLSDERFVPGSEIKEVYREGNLVRVQLRGWTTKEPFFQFWTVDAATASTIVRLLPTTRTIEIEATAVAPPLIRAAGRVTRPSNHRPVWLEARLWITLTVILCGLASLFSAIVAVDHRAAVGRQALSEAKRSRGSAAVSANSPSGPSSLPVYSTEEITAARQELDRFVPELDTIEIEFGTKLADFQNGWLSRERLILALESPLRRLDYMRVVLGTDSPSPLSLRATVRARLDTAALQWSEALVLYIGGLQENDPATIDRAFARIRDAEMSQRHAESLVNQSH